MRSAVCSVRPREVRRNGEMVRVYRSKRERVATYGGFALIFAGASGPLALFIAKHSHHVGGTKLVTLIVLLAVYVMIPLSVARWVRRFGIEVSDAGLRNISTTRVGFIPWDVIQRFVVARYTPLSSCVCAVHGDGSVTPLNALARWTVWADGLNPYRDALNLERERVSRRFALQTPRPS